MRDGKFSLHYPLGKPISEPFDINHINTVLERADGAYVLAHNRGESEVYRINPLSFGIEWRQKIGRGAHNIWFDDDQIRVCSSLDHSLIGLDGLNIYIGGYPRGYCFNGNIRLVGTNEVASRQDRTGTVSKIIILDKSYAELSSIELTGEGPILDIMEIKDSEFEKFISASQP